MNTVSMYYGGYQLTPVPLVEISKRTDKTSAGKELGTVFTLSLNGTITALESDLGLEPLLAKQRLLREAFCKDGKYFEIRCGTDTLLEAYPRIVGEIQFNNSADNWVQTIPYNITLEFDHDPANVNIVGLGENSSGDCQLHPEYISGFNESWSLEFDNQYNTGCSGSPIVMRLTHDVSAVGKMHYEKPSGGSELTGVLGKQPWEQARDYIDTNNVLGFDIDILNSYKMMNLSGESWTPYDHYRVVNINEDAGSVSIQENWVVLNQTGVKALEDFTIQVSEDINQEYNSVSIQGSIRGLEDRTYGSSADGFTINSTKYANAQAYYTSVTGDLYNRVNALTSATINTEAISKSVAYNCNQGTIGYTYNFNDRPENCIAGSRFSSINVEESSPTSVYTSIQIPGRANGPILQEFNTVNEATKSISIEALYDPVTCTTSSPTGAAGIVNDCQTDFESRYTHVIKTSDRVRWNPTRGRYFRSVSWVGSACP